MVKVRYSCGARVVQYVKATHSVKLLSDVDGYPVFFSDCFSYEF